jgi:hypothetical protein
MAATKQEMASEPILLVKNGHANARARAVALTRTLLAQSPRSHDRSLCGRNVRYANV